MKKLVLGAALAAVVVFVWGFLFWGVLPIGNQAIQGVNNDDGAQKMLAATFRETGVYMVPYARDPSDPAYQARHQAGPIATIYFRAEGSEPMAPSTFVMGLLHGFLAMLVMGLALTQVTGGFGARLTVVLLAGLAGSIFAQAGGPIWWLEPWSMAIVNIVYEAVAWLLAAITLAWFVTPGRARED